jgi:hypothetical protein
VPDFTRSSRHPGRRAERSPPKGVLRHPVTFELYTVYELPFVIDRREAISTASYDDEQEKQQVVAAFKDCLILSMTTFTG